MPDKMDWLKDEMSGVSKLTQFSTVMKFLKGKVSGPSDVVKCAMCPNMCRHACPISIVDGKETTSPAGKSRVGMMLENEVLRFNEENVFPLQMCLSCGCCENWCPFDFSVSDILRPQREESIKQGVDFKQFDEMFKALEMHGSVHGKVGKEKNYPEEGEVLYLRGCEFRENDQRVIDKTMQLFEKLDESAFVLPGEECCGIPAYNAGNTALFEELAKKMAKKINMSSAKKVVTSCPSCAYAYERLYPEFSQGLDVEVLHMVEYLEEKKRLLNLEKKGGSVTFHEPCKLVNGLGKKKSMRDVLENSGLSLKIPRRSGEKTFCCGYGGTTVSRLNEELSSSINEERLKELKGLSKNIVTACPSCKEAFQDNHGDVKVYDIAELFNRLL